MNREGAKDARKTKTNKPLYNVRYVQKNGEISAHRLNTTVLKLVDSEMTEKGGYTRIDLPDGYTIGGYMLTDEGFQPTCSKKILDTAINAILFVVNRSRREKARLLKQLDRVIAVWPEEK